MSTSFYAGHVSDEDKQPRKRPDKGKGKMKVMPELPEDVWRRIFELRYDDICEGWQATGLLVEGLTPLLISSSLSRVAAAVLYSHPHISEGKLDRFISNVQRPYPQQSLNNKIPLVHHLTVRPTPLRPKDEEKSAYSSEKPLVDSSLPSLIRLFPTLHSFVLRDCLIHTQQDAITVFTALPLTKPKKARLEIRMWPLSDTEVGRDLAVATKFSAHGFARPTTTTSNSATFSSGMQGAWRDAVYGDRDMDLPRDWLDPEEIERNNDILRAQRQAAVAATNIAAPHDWADPLNPSGPRLQVPVAHLDALGRAIELCRDVFRTDFARTSVPNDNLIRQELVRMGPFRPQMTRQHAIIVLQRLGHHLPANAPEARDRKIVKKAEIWANIGRNRVMQDAKRNRQLAQSTAAQIARREQFGAVRSQSQSAKLARLAAGAGASTAGQHRASAETHNLSATWFSDTYDGDSTVSTADDGRPGSRSAPIYVRDSDDSSADDIDAEMLQDALRQSRIEAEALYYPGEASSSGSHGGANIDTAALVVLSDAEPNGCLGGSDGEAIHPPASSAATNNAPTSVKAETDDDMPDSTPVNPQAVSTIDDVHDGINEANHPTLLTSTSVATAPPAPIWRAIQAGEGLWSTPDQGPVPTSTSPDRLQDHIARSIQSLPPSVAAVLMDQGQSGDDASEISDEPLSPSDYHLENGIDPFHPTTHSWNAIIDELMNLGLARDSARLASAIRKQMLHMIQNTWSPTLQAFSLVALDPLASLLAQSPNLDLWVSIAVPHIRVHMPRSINSLAIFKGSVEHARDRERPILLAGRLAAQNLLDPNNDSDLATFARTLRGRNPRLQRDDPIVGGDGSGGGLVHPDTRLFEVEVNTLREMMDDSWDRAGAGLPPQVCRILTGLHDWAEANLRVNSETRQEDVGFPSPKTDDYASPPCSGSDGDVDSDDDRGSLDGFALDDDQSAGEGYDAEAAKAQAERLAQRKRDRAAGDTAD